MLKLFHSFQLQFCRSHQCDAIEPRSALESPKCIKNFVLRSAIRVDACDRNLSVRVSVRDGRVISVHLLLLSVKFLSSEEVTKVVKLVKLCRQASRYNLFKGVIVSTCQKGFRRTSIESLINLTPLSFVLFRIKAALPSVNSQFSLKVQSD